MSIVTPLRRAPSSIWTPRTLLQSVDFRTLANWKLAQLSGLVVDVASDEGKQNPHPVLDNDYEIRPCRLEPHEDPARNKAEAERQARRELQFTS